MNPSLQARSADLGPNPMPPRGRDDGEAPPLTAARARSAVLAVAPAIAGLLAMPHVSARGVLHLVVLDPRQPHDEGAGAPRILYQHSLGDRANWDVDYADYACSKARLSWRHRMDSRRLPIAERCGRGDAAHPLWGGIWRDGLVVAASGAFPHWDECFALMVVAQLNGRAVWPSAIAARLEPRAPGHGGPQ